MRKPFRILLVDAQLLYFIANTYEAHGKNSLGILPHILHYLYLHSF